MEYPPFSYQSYESANGTTPSNTADLLVALGAFCSTTYPSVSAAIDIALDLVMRHIGVRSAFVARVVNGHLEILDAHDHNGCGVDPNGITPLEETFCQYVYIGDSPFVIPNTDVDPQIQALPLRSRKNIGSYVGVPVYLSNGICYGTVCALDPTPRRFDPTHVAFLRVVAQHLGHLIERDQTSAAEVDTLHVASVSSASETTTQPLLNVVAHDIRTPLASIRGYAELLSTGLLGDVTLDQQQAGERILDAVQWINRLVNDLLDAAAAEGHMFRLVPSIYEPEKVLHQVAEMCRVQAHDRSLALDTLVDGPLPQVFGDIARVKQILLNYLSNALRYTAAGTITVQAAMVDTMLEFRVSDTGSGIPAEQLQQIWKRNVRATSTGPGVGLGLYVVHRLASSMGGEVGVESAVGQGSSFWVRFPLVAPPPRAVLWNEINSA